MKPKTCLLLLFLSLVFYSVYVYYSGLTISEPVEYNGMKLQKRFWTASPYKMLGFILIIIGFGSYFLYLKKYKKKD